MLSRYRLLTLIAQGKTVACKRLCVMTHRYSIGRGASTLCNRINIR